MTALLSPCARRRRVGPRRHLFVAVALGSLVLSGCSSPAAPASGGNASVTSATPKSGYLVYWDQDEEVDYFNSSSRSQGQLMAPYDLNGQVCVLNDGTGRFIGGSDPTNPSQHNPGGPPNYPFKQPPDSEMLNNIRGQYTGKTLYVPGPFRMAPGQPGQDAPADSTGVFNGQATYTGCAVDAEHNIFASDIGTAQGSFPIPTNGRLVEWFAPSYTSACILYGPDTGGIGPNHTDGSGGLSQPGMMTALPNGNILVPQAGSTSGGFPGNVLEFDHQSFPSSASQCPGGTYSRSAVRSTVFFQATTDNLPVPMGVALDPTCGCYAISSIFGGGPDNAVIKWFNKDGTPVDRPSITGESLATFGSDSNGFNPFGMAFAPDGTLYFVDIHITCQGTLTNCGPSDYQGRVMSVHFGPGRAPREMTTVSGHFAFPTSVTICVPGRQVCPYPSHSTPLPTPESPSEGE